jgi:polar amino acid transport system substrate-binding protein
MPKKSVVLAALLGALSGTSRARLHLTSEVSAPASMRDGTRVTGYSADKIREMMTRAGIDYTIELLSWRRAYASARERPDGCVHRAQ